MDRNQIQTLRDESLRKFQAYLKAENELTEHSGFIDMQLLQKFAKAKQEWERANNEGENAWLLFLAEQQQKK